MRLRNRGVCRALDVQDARVNRRLSHVDGVVHIARRRSSRVTRRQTLVTPEILLTLRTRVSALCRRLGRFVFHLAWNGRRMGWITRRVHFDGARLCDGIRQD